MQGLRIDHIDGLYDPLGYCRKLQDRAAYLIAETANRQPPALQNSGLRLQQPFYVVVEKILAKHECLRPEWPVAGTTGYDFMNLAGGLFVDPASEKSLTATYDNFLERVSDYDELLLQAKHLIMNNNLASELNVLATELLLLARQNWQTRDFTLMGIRRALANVTAHFGVYRTYVTPPAIPNERINDADRRELDRAVGQARAVGDSTADGIYDFLYDVLTTDAARRQPPTHDPDIVARVAQKYQQFTGPVMAKSLEDTLFYRYFRLVSLNEVGGDPTRFGVSPAAFHHVNQERLRQSPHGMLATATHDHKRGEDTRVRIHAISEISSEWARAVQRWKRLNRQKRREIDGRSAPGRNDEYLFYQMLIGAWPLNGIEDDFADRMVAYMIKATREAKQRSSWNAPNAEYETALEDFVRAALDPDRGAAFIADFQPIQQRCALTGAVSGLAQTLLRLTAPGVPDLYRGTEYWDLSLVDPDNRRPVDFAARQASLAKMPNAATLLKAWRDGRIKQHIIACALRLRAAEPSLFALGDYIPLAAEGPHADRMLAFLRRHGESAALIAVPRLVMPLMNGVEHPLPKPEAWVDTRLILPDDLPTEFINLLTNAKISAGTARALPARMLFQNFPVALLTVKS